MLFISGWESLFIEYQREYEHVSDVIDRRVFSDGVEISPEPSKILDVFRLCPMDKVKLIILAQEPYKEGATGIAFSSDHVTPSLKVLSSWLEIDNIQTDLTPWVEQGVLLLNASMSIEVAKEGISHKVLWEAFIRGCLTVCSRIPHIVFLLLGNIAESYSTSIKNGLIIREKHPAYYARNNIYETKRHIFKQINKHLISYKQKPIDFWCIDAGV